MANGAQFIRDGSRVWERLVLWHLPLRARTLPCVEYAEDLQTISANPIRDHVGPVGYCPFTGVFDPAFTTHGREQSQFVDAGENGIGEVISSLWIFKGNVIGFVLPQEGGNLTPPA